MLHIKKCLLIKERNTEIPQFYTFKGTTKTQNQGKTEKKKNMNINGGILSYSSASHFKIYTHFQTQLTM